MKSEATWSAVVGAVIALLSAMGLVTASEGTALTTSAAGAITGIIGVVMTVKAIIKRRKEGKDEESGSGGDSKVA